MSQMTTPATTAAQGAATSTGTSAPAPATPMQGTTYNIANLSQPQVQSASTTAPMATAVQNAQQAAADQAALNTFFGTGTTFAPQYEVNYQQVPTSAYAQSVSSGTAANPT
jgi:isochorismate hydrolase